MVQIAFTGPAWHPVVVKVTINHEGHLTSIVSGMKCILVYSKAKGSHFKVKSTSPLVDQMFHRKK